MLVQTQLCPAQSIEPSKDARTDKVSRKVLAPKKELTLRRGDAFITFFPEGVQRLTYGIDHLKEAPIIGKQWFSWAPAEDKHYRWHIAPARTYAASLQVGLLVDVCWLKSVVALITCASLAPLCPLPFPNVTSSGPVLLYPSPPPPPPPPEDIQAMLKCLCGEPCTSICVCPRNIYNVHMSCSLSKLSC